MPGRDPFIRGSALAAITAAAAAAANVTEDPEGGPEREDSGMGESNTHGGGSGGIMESLLSACVIQ